MSDVRDATSEETRVQPLELASIRDVIDEPRSSAPRRSLPGMELAVLAIALAVWSTLLDTHAEVGPGPVLCAVVAIAWGLCAFSVCRQRPNELLGFLTALLFMYAPIKKLSRVNANLQQPRRRRSAFSKCSTCTPR